MTAHEDLSRSEVVKAPSNRSFGLVFTAGFLAIGLWPLVKHEGLRTWALALSAVFVTLTLAAPVLLTWPNKLWLRFGQLLNRVVSPVALAVLFFGVVTPTGLLMRAVSRSGRRWRKDPSAGSYWSARTPPGPPPASLRNQF